MTIYVVACTNYTPPEINSVWSERQLATARRDLLNKTRYGVHKVFTIVLDSGKFDVGSVPWDNKPQDEPIDKNLYQIKGAK